MDIISFKCTNSERYFVNCLKKQANGYKLDPLNEKRSSAIEIRILGLYN